MVRAHLRPLLLHPQPRAKPLTSTHGYAPPYNKEYIDQYRHRIKADPDPEAHFLYAKYLIDAAKYIRTPHNDQRAAKKYTEVLIGESLKSFDV